MILGLDISTSIIGATIVHNNEVIFSEAWDLRNKNKYPDMFVKAAFVKEKLGEINQKYAPEAVYIEKSLQMFRSGFSSAKTLSTLSSFNGIVSFLCFQNLGKTPEYVSASSARKQCGISVPRGEKAKQVVLKFLLDNEPAFNVEYTKAGNPKPKYFDIADSIIIARAGQKLVEQRKTKSY